MRKIINFPIAIVVLFSLILTYSHATTAESNKMHVIEILHWNSLPNVTDQEMIDAVQGIVVELRTLPGFQHQSLTKSPDGKWVDVYFWETKKDAHKSGELMAGRDSFNHLLSLIDPNSIKIEIFPVVQQSGAISFSG